MQLFPFQRGIADAISEVGVERITLIKPVQVGFTFLLVATVANFCANEPSPVLVVLPTEADCRNFMVSEIEPVFAATPDLRSVIGTGEDSSGRNTLVHRIFPGGSLKLVAAKAPRNLRSHKARILLLDEVDAMEASKEGNALTLAENRTVTFRDRKIIQGSTPTDESTSNVNAAWGKSDQRIYECVCPACGSPFEILWQHIEWEPDKPETAACRCPHCKDLIPERLKPQMVAAGDWRITKPEIKGHAGFRLNALVSPVPNVTWPKLAAEFLAAKRSGPEDLKVFVNTKLGQVWREGGSDFDAGDISKRVENFGLGYDPVTVNAPGIAPRAWLPEEVLRITTGTDVQDDRLETTILGHSRTDLFVLDHVITWGSYEDDETWAELDALLKTRVPHPFGGALKVDASIVDSGDGDHTDAVYKFCFARTGRRVLAGKGMGGARRAVEMSKTPVKGGGRLWVMGVDTVKSWIFNRLDERPTTEEIGERTAGRIRFAAALGDMPEYFEQLTAETRVIRYTRGQPQRRFERKPGMRAETLDCLVYAWAAHQAMRPNWLALEQRARFLDEPKRRSWSDIAAELHS